MSGDLDSFLKSGNPSEDSAPPPVEKAPEATPDSGGGGNKDKPPVTTKAVPTPPEPDDDAEPGEPAPHEAIVPRTAYEKERQRRQNWVERASKAEAERDMLAKQLEAAKAPPPASTPPPQYEPIDPARDPAGYTRRVQGMVLNERLNTSEMMAVDKHGKEKIDGETAYFQQRAKSDPALFQKLYSTPHPYQWMIDDNATARLHEEIGSDPAAYEAKLRARWEQERGADPPPVSPAAGLPPSLASARSAAPRGTNGFSGPPSLADILTRPQRRS